VSGAATESEPNLNTDRNLNTVPPPTDIDSSASSYAQPSSSLSGSALYVVKKSLIGSIVPALLYLFFIASIGLFSGFSLYSIILVVFFLLVALVPALFSPRSFEFYDESLKIHKIIGGGSEIPYSSLSLLDYPARGRSQQVVLSVAGQRRPLIIGKNPTNQSLGMDLKQFLNSKLKKPESSEKPGNDNSQGAKETDGEDATAL